jgi:hypothetical protein
MSIFLISPVSISRTSAGRRAGDTRGRRHVVACLGCLLLAGPACWGRGAPAVEARDGSVRGVWPRGTLHLRGSPPRRPSAGAAEAGASRQALRLRGGFATGWQYRLSKETIDIINASDYMQAWYANSTEESRPLIQQDSLLHVAKLWRDRYTGADGQLQADPFSESFRTADTMETDGKAYGIWVNTLLDRPCILLRGDAVGIGGTTIADHCSRAAEPDGAEKVFRYAGQEAWYQMGLYVDATVLAEIPGQILAAAGAKDIFHVTVACLLDMPDEIDEYKVCLNGVFDEHGRELLDIPGASLKSQFKFCVLW